MSDIARNQLTAIGENSLDIELTLNRQNVDLFDYHTAIRLAKDQDMSIDDAGIELGRIFKNLETDFSDIEKKSGESPATISSLGLASFLSSIPPVTAPIDATAASGESKTLYEELIATYSANDRTREYCNAGLMALSAYSHRRTAKPNLRPRPQLTADSHLKLMQFLASINSQVPTLSFQTFEKPAMGNLIDIGVDRVFRMAVVIRSYVVEAVIVRGSEENFDMEPKSKTFRNMDLWTPSVFEVFRILTRNAQAAVLHFFHPHHQPESSLKNYLQWINSLANIFTVPCRRCGKHLDHGVPPTFRDYKSLASYHETCRLLAFTPL